MTEARPSYMERIKEVSSFLSAPTLLPYQSVEAPEQSSSPSLLIYPLLKFTLPSGGRGVLKSRGEVSLQHLFSVQKKLSLFCKEKASAFFTCQKSKYVPSSDDMRGKKYS